MTRASSKHSGDENTRLAELLAEIRACRVCADTPTGQPLPHTPRPVIKLSRSATIAICGQAPGTRVHASGLPFDDASGVRLRDWMGVTRDQFYDERRMAFFRWVFVSQAKTVMAEICRQGLNAPGSGAHNCYQNCQTSN